jgi:hypothetical protein
MRARRRGRPIAGERAQHGAAGDLPRAGTSASGGIKGGQIPVEETREAGAGIWRSAANLVSTALTIIGGVSVGLGIIVYILKMLVGDLSPPSYVSSIRLFAAAARDAGEIVASEMRAMDAASSQSLRAWFSISGMKDFHVSTDCASFVEKRADCDVYFADEQGIKVSEFQNSANLETVLKLIAVVNDYATFLVNILDTKNDDQLAELLCKVTTGIQFLDAAIKLNKDCIVGEIQYTLPIRALRFFGFTSVGIEDRKFHVILSLVQGADPDIDELAKTLAMITKAARSSDENGTLQAISQDERFLYEGPKGRSSHDPERQRIFDKLLDDVRHLRVAASSDPSKTISNMRKAHRAVVDSLAGADKQRELARRDLAKLAATLAEVKEGLETVKK